MVNNDRKWLRRVREAIDAGSPTARSASAIGVVHFPDPPRPRPVVRYVAKLPSQWPPS